MLQANIKLAVNVQWIPPKCFKFFIRLQIVLNTEDEIVEVQALFPDDY